MDSYSSDSFSNELDQMIAKISQGKEVISMDESQRRQVIYDLWVNYMSSVMRALKKNNKVILVADADHGEPIHVLLGKNYPRQPDRMFLSPNYNHKGTPEEAAKLVEVSYWPTFFQETDDHDCYSDDGGERYFEDERSMDISSLAFKKELALFIAGKMEC